MALRNDKRRWVCFHLLTVYVGFNDGFQVIIQTPLIGLKYQYKWLGIPENYKITSIGVGLLMKVWQFEGDYIFRWWKEYRWR